MKALILAVYSLVMLLELSVLAPPLTGLAQRMAEKQAVILAVCKEWGW